MSPVYVVLIVAQVLFATLPIAVKLALHDLSSPALALLRVTGAALLFVALQLALVRERVRTLADYGWLALFALFGVVLNQVLYITALTLTTATAAQMLQTVGPAATLLIAILLRREGSTAGKWVGIVLAASGAVFLVGAGGEGAGSAAGNLLALLNVLAFSLYLVISRGLIQRYEPLTVITWVFVFGAVGIAPWGLPSLLARHGAIPGSTWAALAWIVVFPTVAGYYMNVWALQRVESSVVAVYVYLQPVVTALLAGPVLGERLSPRLLPAAALIFVGVTASVWAERRTKLRHAGSHVAEQENVEM